MNDFKDFGIKEPELGLVGDKIKAERILDKEITVERFKIEDSKAFEGEKCLHVQILKGEDRFVIFTSSASLIHMIRQVPPEKFPFKTILKKENGRYKFS